MGIRITEETREKIKQLDREGYFVYEIAKELDLPEFVVVNVLKKG